MSVTPRIGKITRANSAYTSTATPRILNGTLGGHESSDGGDHSLGATSVSSLRFGGGGRAPTLEPPRVEYPSNGHSSRDDIDEDVRETDPTSSDPYVVEVWSLHDSELRAALVAARRTIVQWEQQYGEIVAHYRGVVADQAHRFEAALHQMEAVSKKAPVAHTKGSTPHTSITPGTARTGAKTSIRGPTDPRIAALRTSPGPAARRGTSPSTSRLGNTVPAPGTGRHHVDPNSRPCSVSSRQSSSGRADSKDGAFSRRLGVSAQPLSTGRRSPNDPSLSTGNRSNVPSTGRRTPTTGLMMSVRSNNSSDGGVRHGLPHSRPATPSMVQRRNVVSPSTTLTARGAVGSRPPPVTARASSKERGTSRPNLFGYKGDERSTTPQTRKVVIPSALTSAPYSAVGSRSLMSSHAGESSTSPRSTKRLGMSSSTLGASQAAAPQPPHQTRGTGAPGYPPVEPHLVLRRSATPGGY